MKNLFLFVTLSCLLLTSIVTKGSHKHHNSTNSKKKASNTQIKCGGQEFAWLKSDFSSMSPTKIDNPMVCDGAGKNGEPTCCTNDDFKLIQEKWKDCESNANQSIYAHNIKNIADKFDLILLKAKETLKTVQAPKKTASTAKKTDKSKAKPAASKTTKSDKKPTTKAKTTDKTAATAKKSRRLQAVVKKLEVTEKVYQSLKNVEQGVYKKSYFDEFQKGAAACYNYLNYMMKGAMCSYCTSEASIRWSNKDQIQVSNKDLHYWSKECGTFIEADRALLGYIDDVQNVFQAVEKSKQPKYVNSVSPLIKFTELKEIMELVKKCAKDDKNCEAGAEKMGKVFAMSTLTRLDLENYQKVKQVASEVIKLSASPKGVAQASKSKKEKDEKKKAADDKKKKEDKEKAKKDLAKKEKNTAVTSAKKKRRALKKVAKRDRVLTSKYNVRRFLQMIDTKPFMALCKVPFVVEKMVDGSPDKEEQYSPRYTVKVNKTLKRSLGKMDTKMTVAKLKNYPVPKIWTQEKDKDNKLDTTCKVAYKFGLASVKSVSKARSSRVCPNVQHSCCKLHSMIKFRTRWADNGRESYMHRIKQCNEAPLYLSNYLAKTLNTQLTQKAHVERSSYCNQDPKNKKECQDLKDDLNNQTKSLKTKMGDYNANYKKCWDRINKLKGAFLCLACDSDAQSVIDTENKQINVTSPVLRELVEYCYDMARFEENNLVPLYATYLQFADTVRRKTTDSKTPVSEHPATPTKSTKKPAAKDAKKSASKDTKKTDAKKTDAKSAANNKTTPAKKRRLQQVKNKTESKTAKEAKKDPNVAQNVQNPPTKEKVKKIEKAEDKTKTKKLQNVVQNSSTTHKTTMKQTPDAKDVALSSPHITNKTVRPMISAENVRKAYELYGLNASKCIQWLEGVKGEAGGIKKKLEEVNVRESECNEFVLQLSTYVVGFGDIKGMYHWRSEAWPKTKELFDKIGNRFATAKWGRLVTDYCFPPKKKSARRLQAKTADQAKIAVGDDTEENGAVVRYDGYTLRENPQGVPYERYVRSGLETPSVMKSGLLKLTGIIFMLLLTIYN